MGNWPKQLKQTLLTDGRFVSYDVKKWILEPKSFLLPVLLWRAAANADNLKSNRMTELFITSAFGFGAEFANVSLRSRLTASHSTSQTPGLVISSKISKMPWLLQQLPGREKLQNQQQLLFFDG